MIGMGNGPKPCQLAQGPGYWVLVILNAYLRGLKESWRRGGLVRLHCIDIMLYMAPKRPA